MGMVDMEMYATCSRCGHEVTRVVQVSGRSIWVESSREVQYGGWICPGVYGMQRHEVSVSN